MLLFRRLLKIFTPPESIPQLPLEAIDKGYKKHRRMIFSGIFIGYCVSYLVRSNLFSLAMPFLIKEYGFSKSELGVILAAFSIAYGFSKFLMGNVSDRSNPRYFLGAGLVISTLVAFIFGYTAWACSGVIAMFTLMFISGWSNGMCYPPCGRVLAHWYSVKERGLVMSVWNVSHNLGGAIVGPIAILGMWLFGDWRSIFYFPALIVAAFTILVLITVRDTPQSVGLPSIEDYHSKKYLKSVLQRMQYEK